MSSYYREAFDIAVKDAKYPERWFVVLVSSHQAYGGPEEGGWWYDVSEVEAYREYPTRDQADAAKAAVEKLAKELSANAGRRHGEYCLATMEWLEARGLDADYLAEPDGPTRYYVVVEREVPVFDNHRPHYC